MKNDKCIYRSLKIKRIFWGTIAGLAFLKAIEGSNHIFKKKHGRKNNNIIIYLYR